MARREGPVHVATTRRLYKGRTYESFLLRRTFRDGGKVRHETVGNLSHLPREIIELIRTALRGETLVPAGESFEIVRSLPHGHVAAVLGSLRKVGLDRLIESRRSRSRDLAVALIASRILDPRPKLATARELAPETAASSLGEVLGLGSTSEDELYAAMDWLGERQERIERALAARQLDEGCLVLYDVSSSYYTGSHCALAKFGHDRDGKGKFPQIVYGLLCDRRGCPVAIEVFEGNTSDPTTLATQIEKIRKRFGLRRVVLVGDRGMITEARIEEELAPIEGLRWITALRAPAIQALAEKGLLQMSLFDRRDLAEISSPDYPGERLVACFNPILAAERARKREELLQATEKSLNAIVEATRRVRRPLRGRAEIGLRAGAILNRKKVGKHFELTITETTFSYRRHTTSIEREAALDGVYVIRSSVPKAELDAPETVVVYKSLATVERAFRSLKTVDLKIRPIHHRLEGRVRAHVFLCMLAYYVEWHMRQLLTPLLFDDDDPEIARARRRSVVAPARRSPSAEEKAATKRTEEDLPVHSFPTLLRDLATIAKNRVRSKDDDRIAHREATFEVITSPTPIQRKALDRLGVALVL